MKTAERRPGLAAWRTSSYCANSECAQVARDGDRILLRSTLAPEIIVTLTPAEFRALRLGIQAGEFDNLG
jgi:hypothetical protein